MKPLIKEGDTHVRLDRLAHHFTIDFEAEMTEKDRQEAWKFWVWHIVSGLFNLFR